MKITIRTDSSTVIGTGHLMRCLALAERMRQDGAEVEFICRDLPGNMTALVGQSGFKLHLLSYVNVPCYSKGYASWLGVRWFTDAYDTSDILSAGKPDTLIVDHYSLDARWEERQRPFAGHIFVIDDLANRHHDCDLFLDQNLHKNPEERYEMLLSENCAKLFGPSYALLRPEFAEARRNIRLRDGQVKRILVFFGGSDPGNETGKALEAISGFNRRDITVEVVVGSANLHLKEIQKQCASIPGANLYRQVNNMAEFLAQADLSLGAGGTTTWERCSVGLPSIIISVAENQVSIAKACHEAGGSNLPGAVQ